jgi:hypothetical protein
MARPIEYRDQRSRIWSVTEIARLNVVSPSIDGPNLCLVIRFEREGEERFARWIGGDEWIERGALHRLFAEAEPTDPPHESTRLLSATAPDTGVGEAPAETVAIWVEAVATMGPEELADFEERTLRQWDPRSLGELRGAIRRRRQALGDA